MYIMCPEFGGSSVTTVDIDNTGTTGFASSGSIVFQVTHPGKDTHMITRYGANTASRVGIVVGTGTNAVAITDYKLQTQIANGDGGSEFIYFGCWVYNHTVGATTASFDVERLFYNDSGGSITVNEIGVYTMTKVTTSPNYANFCVLRDKLSSGVAVADGEWLKVKYTVTVSV